MELQNSKKIIDQKFSRKKILKTIGIGSISFFALKIFPLNYLLTGKNNINSSIKIKSNPLAVSRNKKGSNNVAR
ncbi:MAG: hypothetical protein HXY49_03045 [Ignavibacteriaceae bacterium]|nr:hypothetical protein [Ignavibacteriaceae bacterium]